jgi:hypothetical protein
MVRRPFSGLQTARWMAGELDKNPARQFERLSATECDRAGNRSGPGAHGVPVIAALDDPLPVFTAHDLSHMVGPHHDGANGRPARICSIVDPGPGQIERGTWVSSDLPTHEPAAPGARASGVIRAVTVMIMRNMAMMMMTVMSAMMMAGPSLRRCCACTKQCCCQYEVTKHESPRFGKGIAPPSELESAGRRTRLNFAEQDRAKLNGYYWRFQPA